VLGLVLGSPVQDRHECTEKSLAKGHKDDQGTGASLIGGEAEKAMIVQLGEEKAKRRSNQCV